MKELFLLIRERLLLNESLVLATVTKSSGSTPRGSGARMLAGKGPDGTSLRLWGSIGGGLPEHLALQEAASLLQNRKAHNVPLGSFKKYMLRPEEAAAYGAACGGDVTVFFRTLNVWEPGLLEGIEKGITCFSGGNAAWFIMEVMGESSAIAPDGSLYENTAAKLSLGIAGEEGWMVCTGDEPKNIKPLLKSAPVFFEEDGRFYLSEPLVSGGFVYIFGGGHIAQELVPLLAHLGFRCVVFDDREEFSRPELFPGAEKVILGDFEHMGKFLSLGEKDYAVIITRGHLWDMEAWAFALQSPAAYIGVIGSRTKHEFVKERLRERGFSPEEISAPRIHAPIGLKIKSDTPEEIAVSIAGELIFSRALLREDGR